MKRDRFNGQSLGVPLNAAVKEARISMIGAGGIGCELLKNLVLSGFGEIHIVDLDTIDLSNLNRQFLFRQEHIKKSKALVAKDAAHKFNPNVRLEAHHANIKDPHFNVAWFRGFCIVFNALDNLDARRHVNKMCLAAGVPLIESGTTGFNGQVQVIKKGETACYDCTTKETPKTFPVCTIRSTPSQPIHCIVWGKSYLLSEIFGSSEDEVSEIDNSEDSENANEIEELKREADTLKKTKEAMGSTSFTQKLFDKVYNDDITRLRSLEDMWKTRRPPEPLEFDYTMKQVTKANLVLEKVLRDGQRAWTLEENAAVFEDSLTRLSDKFQALKSTLNGNGQPPVITFDKDDEDTLDFVTASANLRSIVFHIETKSKFEVKQMAGNIIPAIATTNAIVAGLCVLEAYKVLKTEFSAIKEVFLSPFTPERLLASDKIREPNPDCPVCSPVQLSIAIDISRATLNDLVEDFLRRELGYGEEFVVSSDVGLLYDVDETGNLSKKLCDLGVKGDSFLTIIDDDEESPRVNLILNVLETTTETSERSIQGLNLPSPSQDDPHATIIPRRRKPSGTDLPDTNGHGTNGINELSHTTTENSRKRALHDGENEEVPSAKRKKDSGQVENASNGDAILIDDDGTILIDN